MNTACRSLVFSCVLFGLGLGGAHSAAPEDKLRVIDGHLRQGEWEAARTAALSQIDVGRRSSLPTWPRPWQGSRWPKPDWDRRTTRSGIGTSP